MKGDETIRMIEIVLAIALLAVPAMASSADVLGTYGGIFETEESAFNFPASQDTNIESLTVGNEKAMAFNNIWQKIGKASATNNLGSEKIRNPGIAIAARGGRLCLSERGISRGQSHALQGLLC